MGSWGDGGGSWGGAWAEWPGSSTALSLSSYIQEHIGVMQKFNGTVVL